MGGRGFESRQKRPKLKDENICILGDASFSHKKSIPDQKGARSSASISRVCPGRVGADPGTHPPYLVVGKRGPKKSRIRVKIDLPRFNQYFHSKIPKPTKRRKNWDRLEKVGFLRMGIKFGVGILKKLTR